VARIRRDIGDDEADQDGAAVERFLVEEIAPSILELADGRYAQDAGPAAGDIQVPLMRLGIVQAKRQKLEVSAGPSTSSSRRLARPSHTLRTTEVPSYWVHVFDPVSGCCNRDTWVFQLPISKSSHAGHRAQFARQDLMRPEYSGCPVHCR